MRFHRLSPFTNPERSEDETEIQLDPGVASFGNANS